LIADAISLAMIYVLIKKSEKFRLTSTKVGLRGY